MGDKGASHYEMKQNDQFGRHLVANKGLEGGELIFTDIPFAVGPKADSPPICLGCYCPVENVLCSRCGWPVCGAECESSPHHVAECNVFSATKVRFEPAEDWTASAPQLNCITPLRVLLAKEKDPDRWQREVETLETRSEVRQQRDIDRSSIVDLLVDKCQLGSRFTKALVARVCDILDIHSLEVASRGGFSIRALYPRLALAAHSCVANITYSVFLNDYQAHVRASVSIKTGEPLHICYIYPLSTTQVRREYLLETKLLNCGCQRCTDPTELGTHLSTLKCNKCDNGVILSTNPLDNDAPWKCYEKRCEFTTSGAAVRKILAVVQVEIDQLDSMEPSPQAIEQREATINKYKSVFHPRHALLLSLKQALAQLYGRVEGYALDDLPDIILERQVEFCRLVLKALDAVAPGENRLRGMMLYELHAPLMFLAKSEFGAGLITNEKLKERLQEPIQCLADAARILMRDDPQSPEGITGLIALQSMEQLKSSLDAL